MSEKVKLSYGGSEYQLPVVKGSESELGIDISKFRAESKMITLDTGFGNTGSCQSSITFLNGEEGILRYRGYPIEQLSESASFEEVSFLLLKGELPTSQELSSFKKLMLEFNSIPEGLVDTIKTFPKDAHPMGVLSSCLSMLSAYYPEYIKKTDLNDEEMMKNIAQIMGQMKSILACFYRHSKGEAHVNSNSSLGFAADFLHMILSKDGKDVPEEVARAFDTLLVLHADHEQNCSASAVRVVGSSKVNLFATVSAGVNALWGPIHGGANQAVLEMLESIQEDGGDYEKYILKAKDKTDPFRLMGFGHRVYKRFDPRARIIKKACDTILDKLGVEDPLLDIAKGLEKVALEDSYFVDRQLYPNVDFYSGIIYRALGIPTNMFTCMFALGRAPGWMAQWQEMRRDPAFKISRPRQIYTGRKERNFVDIESR
jgi:citrate synthase